MGPLCLCEDYRTRLSGARQAYSRGGFLVPRDALIACGRQGKTGGSLASHGGFLTGKDKDDTGQRLM